MMKDRVLSILINERPDIDFESETRLIDDSILDSFNIIAIVSELNDEFEIDINVNDLQPENFNSLDAIVDLVNDKLEN